MTPRRSCLDTGLNSILNPARCPSMGSASSSFGTSTTTPWLVLFQTANIAWSTAHRSLVMSEPTVLLLGNAPSLTVTMGLSPPPKRPGLSSRVNTPVYLNIHILICITDFPDDSEAPAFPGSSPVNAHGIDQSKSQSWLCDQVAQRWIRWPLLGSADRSRT